MRDVQTDAESGEPPAPGSVDESVPTVVERWISPFDPADDVDSLAFWLGADGAAWVIATCKATHRLNVYDASTGELERQITVRAPPPVSCNAPTAARFSAMPCSSSSPNHRTQAFALPTFAPMGMLGDDQGVTAFDWVDVRSTLSLPACGAS
jgi:3-phytase